jgi:antitoxin component YwqK of YwqJK toxin-antitoxin module
MQKIILFISFIFSCLHLFCQKNDSLIANRWVNYLRSRGVGENDEHNLADKQYVTKEGDTLVRRFFVSDGLNQVLKEQSLIHNKQNGLEITYYSNGGIKEISYYLNGRLWDVISRADSNGKLQNPGDVHNGSGTRFFFDHYGLEPNCYETYKDGVPEGPFYWRNTTISYLKGELTYKPSVVKFIAAKKVTYANPKGKTTTAIMDTGSYRAIFLADRADAYLKVLNASDDSLPEPPKDYKYIDVNFDDAAIVPRGTWQEINVKNGKPLTTVEFDDNGNPIKVIQYDDKGNLVSQKSLPSYNTRMW